MPSFATNLTAAPIRRFTAAGWWRNRLIIDDADAAAAAHPDKPGTQFTFADMQQHLPGKSVAKQYWPERLEIIAELPRAASGKVRKATLREWLAETAAGNPPATCAL